MELHEKKREIDATFQGLHKKIAAAEGGTWHAEEYVTTRVAIHNVHHEATSLLYSLTYDLLQAIDIVKTLKVADQRRSSVEFGGEGRGGFCGVFD